MKLRCLAIPLLLLYPLYAGVMYAKQSAILFPAASEHVHAIGESPPAGAELVEIAAPFGKARAVYWAPRGSDHPAAAVWFAHGNFEAVQNSYALIQPLLEHGIAVLQFEFPGYDGADGTPTYEHINAAAKATFDWLAARPAVDAQRIVVMGYSIGGGAAAELTRSRHPRALVLLSTFSSIADIAHRYLLPSMLVRYPYDNVARLREFSGPVFVEHGRHDEVIPFELGRRLAGARKGVTFLPQDCGHADCAFDRSVFARRLPQWLRDNGILENEDLATSP
jgi:fermentation-respiration switch protein FrsA (DUF1100 family)